MVTVQSITNVFAKNAAKLAETVKGNICVTVPSDKKGEFIYHLIENGGYPASKKQAEPIFKASKNTESLISALFACHAITLEKPKFIIYDSSVDDPMTEKELPFPAVGVIGGYIIKQTYYERRMYNG